MSGNKERAPNNNNNNNNNKDAGPSDGFAPIAASSSQAEMAQAFKDLARGEQQAAAMEANLSKLESKLDELLAQFDETAVPGSSDSDKVGSNADESEQEKKKRRRTERCRHTHRFDIKRGRLLSSRNCYNELFWHPESYQPSSYDIVT
ncbi:hypothetical protein PG990_005829 [Apiospora arundinis]